MRFLFKARCGFAAQLATVATIFSGRNSERSVWIFARFSSVVLSTCTLALRRLSTRAMAAARCWPSTLRQPPPTTGPFHEEVRGGRIGSEFRTNEHLAVHIARAR